MANSLIPLILMWQNVMEIVYKNLLHRLQYHSAVQLTADQQHLLLCVCTALCCVLREDR